MTVRPVLKTQARYVYGLPWAAMHITQSWLKQPETYALTVLEARRLES